MPESLASPGSSVLTEVLPVQKQLTSDSWTGETAQSVEAELEQEEEEQPGEGSGTAGSSVLTGSSRQKAEVKIMNEQVAKALAKQEAKREKKLQRKKDWDDLYYKVGFRKNYSSLKLYFFKETKRRRRGSYVD